MHVYMHVSRNIFDKRQPGRMGRWVKGSCLGEGGCAFTHNYATLGILQRERRMHRKRTQRVGSIHHIVG